MLTIEALLADFLEAIKLAISEKKYFATILLLEGMLKILKNHLNEKTYSI